MCEYFDKLSKLLDKDYLNVLLNLIEEKCPYKRTPKYMNEYYLYYIVLLLTDLQKWKSLRLLHPEKSKYHYKTIQDKHLEWSNLNIYEEAYKIVLNKYKKVNIKKSANLLLFIDSSDIYNKNGSEQIGYGQDPKKKKTKISAICDKNKTILSLIITKVNKKSTRNTLKNDAYTITETFNNLLIDKPICKSIKLVGDKGYARTKIDRENLLKENNIDLIYPHRRNQKENTPISNKKLLKNRYVIENVFAKLKRFDRICMRKDKLSETFKGFLFLATILTLKK